MHMHMQSRCHRSSLNRMTDHGTRWWQKSGRGFHSNPLGCHRGPWVFSFSAINQALPDVTQSDDGRSWCCHLRLVRWFLMPNCSKHGSWIIIIYLLCCKFSEIQVVGKFVVHHALSPVDLHKKIQDKKHVVTTLIASYNRLHATTLQHATTERLVRTPGKIRNPPWSWTNSCCCQLVPS